MSNIISASKSNPCPHCGKPDWCYFLSDTLSVCKREAEPAYGWQISSKTDQEGDNYYYYSENKKNNYDSDYWQRKREQREKERLEKEKNEQEKNKNKLSIAEIDKYIRLLHSRLGLSQEHRQQLINRGYTPEQIEDNLFFSVYGYQDVSFLPDNFSGTFIGNNGNLTIKGHENGSIACVAFHSGLAVGIQLRHPTENGKYTWLSNKERYSAHLKEYGELPITHLKSAQQCKINLDGLVELFGTDINPVFPLEGIMKPNLARYLHGVNVIGASGFNFTSSQKQVNKIITDESHNVAVLPVDGGLVGNRKLIKRLKKNIDLFESVGCKIAIAWWGQYQKSDGDFDEISSSTPIKFLTVEEFWELANKYQFNQRKKEKYRELTSYTPDITVNCRYVSDIDGITYTGMVVGKKSSMNTGKTYDLKERSKIENCDRPIIYAGSRQILTAQSAKELGLTYIDKSWTAEDVEELWNSGNPKHKRIAIVKDSFLKLKDIDWTGARIIVDEANQGYDHLHTATTSIKDKRGAIYALLAEKLPTVEGIELLDAQLTDKTCQYWSNLSGLPLQKILNTYQENERDLTIVGDLSLVKNRLEELTENNLNFCYVSDSASYLTAQYEIFREKYPQKKAILLTKDNLNDYPELKRFTENKGKQIAFEGIQAVFASPVIQSGLSIELENNFSIELENYFTEVLGYFDGNVHTNVAHQMLVRVRNNAPRTVFVAERGNNYNTNYFPEQILNNDEFKKGTTMDTLEYLEKYERLDHDSAIIKLAELIKQNKHLEDLNRKAKAELESEININKSLYRELFIEESIALGYQVMARLATNMTIDEEITEKRKELRHKQAVRTVKSRELTESQAEVLSNKDGLKEADRDALLKYRVTQFLPELPIYQDESQFVEFVETEILKHRWKRLKQVQSYFYALNPDIAKKLDFNQTTHSLWNAQKYGLFWCLDDKRLSIYPLIFESLSLVNLIGKETITSDDLAEVKKLAQNCRKSLALLGIRFCKKTNDKKLARDVLRVFGFTLLKVKGKDKYSIHSIIAKDTHKMLLESFKLRYSDEIELKYETILEVLDQNAKTDIQQSFEVSLKNKGYIETLESKEKKGSTLTSLSSKDTAILANTCGHTSTIDSELQINEDNYDQAINDDLSTLNDDSYLNHLLNTFGKNYLLAMSNEEFIDRCEVWMSQGLTDLEFNQLLEMKMNNDYAQSSEAVEKSPSETEVKFAPIQIDSENIGQKFKRWSDHLKTCIIKAFYEFQGRFYCDVIWENSNSFEQHLPFSFLEPIT